MPPRFTVEFTQTAAEHLESYSKFESNAILDGIKSQLAYEPLVETRNRKPLRENPLADWELRIQKHRVFYSVDAEGQVVRIVAVGHKERDRLYIGGERIDL